MYRKALILLVYSIVMITLTNCSKQDNKEKSITGNIQDIFLSSIANIGETQNSQEILQEIRDIEWKVQSSQIQGNGGVQIHMLSDTKNQQQNKRNIQATITDHKYKDYGIINLQAETYTNTSHKYLLLHDSEVNLGTGNAEGKLINIIMQQLSGKQILIDTPELKEKFRRHIFTPYQASIAQQQRQDLLTDPETQRSQEKNSIIDIQADEDSAITLRSTLCKSINTPCDSKPRSIQMHRIQGKKSKENKLKFTLQDSKHSVRGTASADNREIYRDTGHHIIIQSQKKKIIVERINEHKQGGGTIAIKTKDNNKRTLDGIINIHNPLTTDPLAKKIPIRIQGTYTIQSITHHGQIQSPTTNITSSKILGNPEYLFGLTP